MQNPASPASACSFFASYLPGLRRRTLAAALRLAARVVVDLNITGVENIPAAGAVLLVGNHISFLDPVIVVSLLPRPVIAMAKAEAFEDKLLGPLVRAFDAFPVRRGEIDRQALQQALRVLEAGLPLWVSPEGTRSPTGQLQHGQNGAAFIAARSGAPVVPVAFTGTDRFKRDIRLGRRAPIGVTIGSPFYLGRGQARVRGEALDRLTEELMRRIAALLPPDMRGEYGEG